MTRAHGVQLPDAGEWSNLLHRYAPATRLLLLFVTPQQLVHCTLQVYMRHVPVLQQLLQAQRSNALTLVKVSPWCSRYSSLVMTCSETILKL